MRKLSTSFAATLGAVALFAAAGVMAANSSIPAYVTAAVSDPARAADKPTDARRHVAELATFAQVKPGDIVVELVPGSGYFTRVFSRIVGAKGHVYALYPNEYAQYSKSDVDALRAMPKQPAFGNVELILEPAASFTAPKPVDVMFTSQNLHDYPDKFMGNLDVTKFCRQVYAALKPGGVLIVIDHAAQAGAGLRDTDTLHRIDPAKARALVEAAGFKFDGETTVLRNAADDHKKVVFDAAIRGHTDQFAYRFKKPK